MNKDFIVFIKIQLSTGFSFYFETHTNTQVFHINDIVIDICLWNWQWKIIYLCCQNLTQPY